MVISEPTTNEEPIYKTEPIYQTDWFIALLVVVAGLFIVLLIFELYTRHDVAKYPGKLN